ncbi:hypothetical protein GO491_11420 [Flavobacteriaceae bacterium Ap0902]|nr:hypothetical protein [Flavobacteriaceae bacterium Ap0902]
MYYRSISIILIFFIQLLNAQNNCNIFSWQKDLNKYKLIAQQDDYRHYLDSLNKNGYYALQVDSMTSKNQKCKVYIHQGKFYSDYITNKDRYSNDLDKIKDSLIHAGKMFNKIILSPNILEKDGLIYKMVVKDENPRTIDDIKFIGYDKIPSGYKQSLLHKNTIANNQNIKALENLVENNKTINLTQSSKISYTRDSSTLFIYTMKQRTNSFDGIMGFSTDENNKLKLSGNVNLNLYNAFNQLEQINLTWFGGENKSQNLDFNLHFPYLFFKYIGIQSDLKIRKQDSTFLQLRWNNGLSYQTSINSYVYANFNLETSNFIESERTTGEDYKKTGFGVGYVFNNDDLLTFNENKTLLKLNTNLLKKTFQEENITQSEVSYELARQQRLWKHHYIYGKGQGQNLIEKENEFLYNELFQLGGISNLRGFNQNSIFTSSFNMLSLAYRYIPNNNFLVEVFSDFALTRSEEFDRLNKWIGLGSGIQFRSNVGIFKLIYAVGKSESQPIDFTNGKVHFGMVATF